MPLAKKTTRKVTKTAARRTPEKRTVKRTMSPAHKRALAEGRTMSATVNAYLSALNTPKRRGRKVTTAVLEQRLVAAQAQVKTATGVEKVLAAQNIRDLEAKVALAGAASGTDIKKLEAGFVKIAKTFGQNRGITYGAWRDAGVPAVVLKRAGVARTRG